MSDSPKLSGKRKRFAAEVLKDGNQSAAAVRAGYSEKSARYIGRDLMDDPEVRAVVEAGAQRIIEKVEVDAEWVLRILKKEGETAEKSADRISAAVHVGRWLKMFTDKVEHSGGVHVTFNIGPKPEGE